MFFKYIHTLLVTVFFFTSFASGETMQLKPCNGKLNCAITQKINNQSTQALPISYQGGRQKAQQKLKGILKSLPRTQVVEESDGYIHATFRSKIWGFVDDFEALFATDKPLIHMRSASRTGKYDFGVNKRRLKMIKKRFEDR